MSNVLVEESSLKAIADSIRAKNGSANTYNPGDMAAAIDEIDVNMPSDMEWANYAITANIDMDSYDTETVTITLPKVTTLNFTNNSNNTVTKHLVLNFGTPLKTANRMFYSLSTSGDSSGYKALEQITLNGDTSQATSFRQMLHYATALTTIDGTPLDFSSSTDNTNICVGCYRLAYIRIVPNTIRSSISFAGSYSLDDESLQSIIDGLADLTGETAQTLTVHADVKARIEANSVWLATITGKNWTLA